VEPAIRCGRTTVCLFVRKLACPASRVIACDDFYGLLLKHRTPSNRDVTRSKLSPRAPIEPCLAPPSKFAGPATANPRYFVTNSQSYGSRRTNTTRHSAEPMSFSMVHPLKHGLSHVLFVGFRFRF
jgi:hypothetical protein